jgi:flagellar protein FliS
MNTATGNKSYLENAVLSAPPEKLVVMLYDGMLRFLNQAIEHIRSGNHAESTRLIGRAREIVKELMVSLKTDTGQIAYNLQALYLFVYQKLVEANFSKREEEIREIITLIQPLRDTWAEAARKRTGGPEPAIRKNHSVLNVQR